MTAAGVATALTLPSGITIDTTRRPRLAVLGRDIILTNATTRSLLIDPDFNVYPLQLQAPASAPVLSSSASGGLTGTFRVKYTYIIKDPLSGRLIAESDFSPVSASSGAITSKLLKATFAPSPDAAVTHTRFYRTLTGPGTVYFPWIDSDGRTSLTSISDDLSDASLQLVAAPTTLGGAPGLATGSFMTLLVEWKDRLWGVGDKDVDVLRYTDIEKPYAWKTSQEFNVPPVGFDQFGITGLAPRRDELGVLKRQFMSKITGDTGHFERQKVHQGKGCIAPESVVVIDDVAYWLGEDGVYAWDSNGIRNISDGRVRKWFTTTTYFNRARFQNAFAKYNQKYHGYELHLAATGASTENRWVVYDIERGKWWGPHLTATFTPTCAQGFFIDSDNLIVPAVGGSDGIIYVGNQSALTDNTSAISVSATTAFHSMETPNITKLFGHTAILFAEQAAAGNLEVAAKIGALDASTVVTLAIDQTKGNRQEFPPLGEGEFCQLVFTESTNSAACQLFGYEIDTFELGRR